MSVCALALAGCGEMMVIPEEGETQPAEAPVTVDGLRLISYEEEGGPSQIIQAASAELYQSGQMAQMDQFSLEFWNREQRVWQLEADLGQVDLDDSTFVAFAQDERIRIQRFDDNLMLYVTQFSYDPESGNLSTTLPDGIAPPPGTDDRFTLIQENLEDGSARVFEGNGIVADSDLNATFYQAHIEHRPEFDLEAFDREFRPIHREDTP